MAPAHTKEAGYRWAICKCTLDSTEACAGREVRGLCPDRRSL